MKKGDRRPKFYISDREEGVYHYRKIQKCKEGSLTLNIPAALAKKLDLKPQQPVYVGLDRNKNSRYRLVVEFYPIEELVGHKVTGINNTGPGEIRPSGVPEK